MPGSGIPASAATTRRLDAVMKTALALRGTNYRLGGETPASGFDCSGFVRYVFERHQVGVPRTVAEQYEFGRKIKIEDIREGDLVFFATTAKGPTHVGIAIGPASPGEFVHAPGSGGAVRVEHFDTAYWRNKLVGVRRVL
jgi:cell wall-associated NlpC family hydrolase